MEQMLKPLPPGTSYYSYLGPGGPYHLPHDYVMEQLLDPNPNPNPNSLLGDGAVA